MILKIQIHQFTCRALIIIAASAALLCTFAQSNWEWRNRLPQGNSINQIEFADGRLVAVGDYGTILSSSDGKSWHHSKLPTTNDFKDVAFGNKTWVAVGDKGTVFTSTDGISWRVQPQPSLVFYCIEVVCFGNGKFVIAGGFDSISTSIDGTTWQAGQKAGSSIFDMIYTGAQFVGVGGDGAVFTSADGASWTKKSAGTKEHLASLVYNGSELISVGSTGVIRSSSDGNVWSAYRDGTRSGDLLYNTWLGIASDAQRVVVVGWSGYSVVFNNDGSTTFPKKLKDTALRCVASGNGVMVAGGSAGELMQLRDSIWTNVTQSGPTVPLSGMAWGNGCFVGVSDYDHIIRSVNGEVWSDTTLWDVRNLCSITFGNGRFLAVDEEKILSSADGLVWKIDAVMPMQNFRSIAYGNSRFVILSGIGDHQLLSSSGDNVWTKSVYTTNKSCISVAFCNDRFLLCGEGGMLRSSTNGVSWTAVQTGDSRTLNNAAWGSNQYVVVGNKGTILTSANGVTWQDRSLPEEWRDLFDVRWCGDRFVAAGYYGILCTSTDGIAWSLDSGVTHHNLNAIAFNEKRIIVAGDLGAIISLDRVYEVSVNPGNVRLTGTAPPLLNRKATAETFDLAGRVVRYDPVGKPKRLEIVKGACGNMRTLMGF